MHAVANMAACDDDGVFRALCDEYFNFVENALSSKCNMNQQLKKDGKNAFSKLKLLIMTNFERLRANN